MAILTTIADFGSNSGDGALPFGGLVMDASGNLFGTTMRGGAYGYGTVFEIEKTADGYTSAPTTLVSFDGVNGRIPYASLIIDAAGNLFGTTGGTNLFGTTDPTPGTVFEVVKTATGYASAPTVLASFDGTNGSFPFAGLFADASGNLFGTTQLGGAYGNGTVFEIAKTNNGYASVTTLLNFNGTNGNNGPYGTLIADAAGNLIGTTWDGGTFGYGMVFEIAKTAGGFAATPTTLVNFTSTTGQNPRSGLIMDGAGNLFGATASGGEYGYGTVFEIAKTGTGYAATPITLASFNESYPSLCVLLMDAAGNLFGTSSSGVGGTILEIAKTGTGYSSTPITLDLAGGVSYAPLIMDAAGHLFGTMNYAPYSGQGSVFELTSGDQYVYNSADQVTINNGSFQYVFGTATRTLIGTGGQQNIYAAGSANATHIVGGVQIDWGVDSNATILSGTQYVFGTATGTLIVSGAQHVGSGGVVKNAWVWAEGEQYIEGGIASNTTIRGGKQFVYGGADHTQISDSSSSAPGGVQSVFGSATYTTIGINGVQTIYSGTATNTTISSGGSQFVYGTADQTTVGGLQNVSGSATNTIINSGGQQDVFAGATVTGTTINAGATQVDWGAAVNTTISGGAQYVWGTATGTTIVSGVQYVGAGGTANGTTIKTGGIEYVFAGGTAHNVTFGGTFAFLGLDQSSAFNGTISGWQDGDKIDLGDIVSGGSTSLVYAANTGNSGGTLTVSDGTHTAVLSLLGQYAAADFVLSGDGHGGTLITNPLAGSQQSLLALPHAA